MPSEDVKNAMVVGNSVKLHNRLVLFLSSEYKLGRWPSIFSYRIFKKELRKNLYSLLFTFVELSLCAMN